MASNESTGLRDRLRTRKREHSRSPLRSLPLGDLLAPPAVTRSPSPALSYTSSRSTTAQLVSHLALGEANDVSEPRRRSVSIMSNTPPTTGAGPSTHPAQKKARTAWAGLEIALKALEIGAGAFPPLKLAVGDLASYLYIIKAAAENQKDYDELASELETMIDTLNKYAKQLGSEDLNGSVANITQSITNEVQHIKKKQNRSKTKRILESAQDKEDVMECYRRIRASFGQLKDNVLLWAVQKINKQDEVNLLQSLSPEEDARYNSSYSVTIKRRGCTAETREKIQSNLQDWVRDPDGAKIYWMNGMAGTGKTTIAYSLCEWLEANKQLGANFFCSRAKESCQDVSRIVPTIACQLARYSPAFRSELCKVLERDQGASKLDMVRQFEKLVKGPFSEIKDAFPQAVVVVVDALDECKDQYGVRLILTTLTRFATSLPIKFFVASRPEPGIFEKMQSSTDYSPTVLHLHNIEESIVEGDIKKYMRDEFKSISPSPSDDQIEILAKRAGKLFIYAATVIRFILPDNNAAVNSSSRLRTMLTTDSRSTSNQSVQKYKELDKLYTTIVAAAFNELQEEEEEAIRLVLWTTICAKEPMNVGALASLLALSQEQVLSALQPLRSVLHVSEDDGVVSTLHASFPDYMFDTLRSGQFYCDKAKHDHLLSERCFAVMKEQLCFNICSLNSSSVIDKRAPGLERKIQECISPVLFYACQYWGDHLRPADVSDYLCHSLVDFLSRRLLFWMEVLNLKKYIRMGVHILRQAEGWLSIRKELGDTRKLVADAQDFVARFAASRCICSTPHIYISALPLCPKTSLVHMHYWGRTNGLIDMKGPAINSLTRAAIAVWKVKSEVTKVIFSPDGTRIASSSDDGIIRVWDSQTGHIIARTSQWWTYPVNTIAFSTDGTRIVSGAGDRHDLYPNDFTIRVWDAQTGESIAGPFAGHKSSVNTVAFSPDGSRIVSGSNDGTTRLWNARTGENLIEPLEGHKGPVNSVAFLPDGNHVVSSSRAGSVWSYNYTIGVWGTRTNNNIANPYIGSPSWDLSVAISPDGGHMVAGSPYCTIRVWDAQTGNTIIGPLRGHTSGVESVAFSPDGARIASGSGYSVNPYSNPDDFPIWVWDALTGYAIAGPFEGHTDWVTSVAFSPDGTRIVSGSNDGSIRLWDAGADNRFTRSSKGHTDSVNSVAFSPDGAHIVSGSNDGSVRVWDAKTGDPILVPFHDHTRRVKLASFSSDGGRIISVSADCDSSYNIYTAETFDARNGDIIANGALNTRYTSGAEDLVAFSSDGARMVSDTNYGGIQLWDSWDRDNYSRIFKGRVGSISSVAFSPDGTLIASGSCDSTIQLWDARTGEAIIGPLAEHIVSDRSASSSPDHALILSDFQDYTAQSWDALNNNNTWTISELHEESVTSVAFSPDGTRLASGGEDGTIHVWDVRTSKCLIGPLNGGTSYARSIAFSSDGTHIVFSSDSNTIQLLDAWTGNTAAGPFVGSTGAECVNSVALSPDGSQIVSGFSNGAIRVWDVNTSASTNSISPWQSTLGRNPDSGSTSDLDWTFADDGWIILNGALFLWLPPDLHSCFPFPPHPFAIGGEGSIQVENWNKLLLGERWSLCYNSEEAQ